MVLDPTDLDTRFINEVDHDKDAHDALALSHDSLSDASINDHHNRDHELAPHTDITITGAQLEALLMFGAANAAYIPCIYLNHIHGVDPTFDVSMLSNVDATDSGWMFQLPLPTVKSGLKLYINNVRVGVYDADGGDYVDTVYVWGFTYDGARATLATITPNRTEQGLYVSSLGSEIDCSGYEVIYVEVHVLVTNAKDLDLSSIMLNCYYAT